MADAYRVPRARQPRTGILRQVLRRLRLPTDIRRRRPAVENRGVSKSLLAIAGIGIAGCLLLSWMMQDLVRRRPPRDGASCAPRLMAAFGDQLAAPLVVREEQEGTSLRLVVHGRVKAAQDKTVLATAIGAEVWRHLGPQAQATEVRVTLRDAEGGGPVSQVVARPSAR